MKLYDYFRSSAAYRVRIALNLKGISYQHIPIHLVRDGGEHNAAAYKAINPQGRVPSLELDDGTILIQSPAILEYIEETYPEPALLPGDAVARARIRAIAAIIGCDIHPIDNLSVLKYLRGPLGQPDDAVNTWYRHWIMLGFEAIEELAVTGSYLCGASPTMADIYLMPQIYNARRFNVDLDAFPKIRNVVQACEAIEAFANAAPDKQPDAE